MSDRYVPLASVAQYQPGQAASAGATAFSTLLQRSLPTPVPPAPDAASAAVDIGWSHCYPHNAAVLAEHQSAALPIESEHVILQRAVDLPSSAPLRILQPPLPPVHSLMTPPVTVEATLAAASSLSSKTSPLSVTGTTRINPGAAAPSGATTLQAVTSSKSSLGVSGTGISFGLIGKSVSFNAATAKGFALAPSRETPTMPISARAAKGVDRKAAPNSARGAVASDLPPSSNVARSALLPPLGGHSSTAGHAVDCVAAGAPSSVQSHSRQASVVEQSGPILAGGPTERSVTAPLDLTLPTPALHPPVPVLSFSNAGYAVTGSTQHGLTIPGSGSTMPALNSAARALKSAAHADESVFATCSSTVDSATVGSVCSSTTAGSQSRVAPAAAACEKQPRTPERVVGGTGSTRRVPVASSASPGGAASQGSAPVFFPDDGEQGFRVRDFVSHLAVLACIRFSYMQCYELVGLDIILDSKWWNVLAAMCSLTRSRTSAVSHCTCKNSAANARLTSRPAAQPAPILPRCQPRPVLLEINQSCSMNSDSTLDRVVKGEALLDGLSLAAPDEQWLLERFIDALSVPQPVPSKGSAGSPGRRAVGSAGFSPSRDDVAACPAGVDAQDAQDAAIRIAQAALSKRLKGLSKVKVTGVAQRASLVGITEARRNEQAHQAAAREEARALMRAVREDPAMPSLVAAVLGTKTALQPALAPVVPTSVALAAHSGAPPPAALVPTPSAGSLTLVPPPKPCTLTLVPWAPIPQAFSLRSTALSAWQEECWYGPAAAPRPLEAAASTPVGAPEPFFRMSGSPKALALAPPPRVTSSGASTSAVADSITPVSSARVSSLSQVPPLSQRAELVLALRRIYEHLHIGGYQQLLPPQNAHAAHRFRRIAEHVPSSLRET